MLRFYTIFLFLAIALVCRAQLSVPGKPKSFSFKKMAFIIPEKQLDTLQIQKLLMQDSLESITNRFATIQYTDINLKRDGLKTSVPGGSLWLYALNSYNAFSLGIGFSEYYLPDGASLFIYNKEKTKLLGAFTSLNNKEDHFLKISELFSNNAVIEYFEPDSAAFGGLLSISSVSLAYKDVSSLLQDNFDINCPGWSKLKDIKHAVCRMIFASGSSSYYCTGSLINNTSNDNKPYFLTAAHCISTQQEASSLVTYFNYESADCQGIAPTTYQTLSGAVICSTNENSDFCLLRLFENPPLTYKPYFAGWDVSGNIYSGVYGIHHPEGTIKKAAYSSYSISNVDYILSWDKGSLSPINTHWRVDYTIGSTQAGSSGSPLLNPNLQIIGQLHGGGESVNYYGKLSVSWNASSNNQYRLKPWLDPVNSGVSKLNGLAPYALPIAGFKIFPEIACINSTVKLTDTSSNSNTWQWTIDKDPSTYSFQNGTNSSSQNPEIIFKDSGTYKISLKVTNSYGSNENSIAFSVKDVINVQIVDTQLINKNICGYQLNNYQIIAKGAAEYSFEINPDSSIISSVQNDTLFLNLKQKAFNQASFPLQIIAHGKHGSCEASSDPLRILVKIAPYDFLSFSGYLKMGQNGPFNNECASVENNEVHPADLGCETINNWCTDINNPNVINNTLWFQFKGPLNGNINIDTKGLDTRIAIYDASRWENLVSGDARNYELIAANDNISTSQRDASLQNIEVTSGKNYWLQIDSYKGIKGSFYVDLYNNDLDVYPNPSNGIFHLILARNTNSSGVVEVFSQLGTLVLKSPINNGLLTNFYNLNLSNKASGIYTVVVTLGQDRYIKKLMLIK